MFFVSKKNKKDIFKLVSRDRTTLFLLGKDGQVGKYEAKEFERIIPKKKVLINKVSMKSELAYMRGTKKHIAKDLGKLTKLLISAKNVDEMSDVLGSYKFKNPLELATEGVVGVAKAHTSNFKKVANKVFGINVSSVLGSNVKVKKYVNESVDRNVTLIKSVGEKYHKEVSELLKTDGLDQMKIKETIMKRYNVSQSRAKLIARNESLNILSSLEEVQQTNIGIKQYRWVTSKDERVRESHEIRDGKIYNWSDSDIKPGEEINCRCIAVGIINRRNT